MSQVTNNLTVPQQPKKKDFADTTFGQVWSNLGGVEGLATITNTVGGLFGKGNQPAPQGTYSSPPPPPPAQEGIPPIAMYAMGAVLMLLILVLVLKK